MHLFIISLNDILFIAGLAIQRPKWCRSTGPHVKYQTWWVSSVLFYLRGTKNCPALCSLSTFSWRDDSVIYIVSCPGNARQMISQCTQNHPAPSRKKNSRYRKMTLSDLIFPFGHKFSSISFCLTCPVWSTFTEVIKKLNDVLRFPIRS